MAVAEFIRFITALAKIASVPMALYYTVLCNYNAQLVNIGSQYSYNHMVIVSRLVDECPEKIHTPES